MQTNYMTFLERKRINDQASGFDFDLPMNPMLFDFQKDIIRWALRRGRAAVFADCGMGKTAMQLEWARHIVHRTAKSVLILAPLSVAIQTAHEGNKFGIKVNICRTQRDVQLGINITNYEMLQHFDLSAFVGVVLDESSILKSFTGKTCQEIIDRCQFIPYRLACTATPAPNDYMELGNHCEFLGVMTRTEMLSTFFTHDMETTSSWRLKGHARLRYWEWLSQWAVVISKPSDLGYQDDGFSLPRLNIKVEFVESENNGENLFAMEASTLSERREARKSSITSRVNRVSEIVNDSDKYLIWCDFNAEADMVTAKINDAVQVSGSDCPEDKESRMIGFARGSQRVLVSKPSICGFGMNFQICHKIIFLGLSDSYESFYQAVRRCWRFGQKYPVDVVIVISKAEASVLNNIKRKEQDAEMMRSEMIRFTKDINTIKTESLMRESLVYRAKGDMEIPSFIGGVR